MQTVNRKYTMEWYKHCYDVITISAPGTPDNTKSEMPTLQIHYDRWYIMSITLQIVVDSDIITAPEQTQVVFQAFSHELIIS